MYRYLMIVVLSVLAITPVAAEEKSGYFDFNNDRFLSGTTAVQNAVGVDDLFMAGATVRSQKDITGSAHLAGRRVISSGAVGGDAYIAGMDVSLDGKVAGDATISGYNVQIGDVGGDLRVSAANLIISGTISGYAIVAGDDVRFESVIEGDVSLTAQDVEFTEDARIEGTLFIYEEQAGETKIPVQVIPADRVERRDASEWSEFDGEIKIWNWRHALGEFFTEVLLVAIIAVLIAVFVPKKLAELRRTMHTQPLRNLWFGFLALSAIAGSTIILVMTGIGLLLAPATVLIALLSTFAGYVIGAYAVGVGLLLLIKRPEPDGIGTRALAAGVGALVVASIALIPFLGWLFVLAVALTGAGSITIQLFRPKFFTTA